MEKIQSKRYIKDAVLIAIGISMASIGLKAFLLPNGFLDGGAMGVALLLNILIEQVDLSIFIVLVNLPFIVIGARQISVTFAIKSTIAIVTLAILVHYLNIPPVTSDKLLIAVFGGFFLGAGIGFSIRGSAVIDGTEVLAVTVSRKTSLTVGDFIAIFNVILFGVAAVVVNVETAMYSMLTYLAASKTVDFIINGIEEYIGVMIVSEQSLEIKSVLRKKLRLGVTVFKSESRFGQPDNIPVERRVLFCATTRLEVSKVIHEVEKIDPNVFIIQYPLKDTKGGMIKKRPFQ